MTIGATHIDHVVISSNDSAATARLFAEQFGIEIKRTMTRPGTGAHMEFAKLEEVVLEFAGPGQPAVGNEVKARLSGFVLAVPDIDAAVALLRGRGWMLVTRTRRCSQAPDSRQSRVARTECHWRLFSTTRWPVGRRRDVGWPPVPGPISSRVAASGSPRRDLPAVEPLASVGPGDDEAVWMRLCEAERSAGRQAFYEVERWPGSARQECPAIRGNHLANLPGRWPGEVVIRPDSTRRLRPSRSTRRCVGRAREFRCQIRLHMLDCLHSLALQPPRSRQKPQR